jgi:hypothetical protein
MVLIGAVCQRLVAEPTRGVAGNRILRLRDMSIRVEASDVPALLSDRWGYLVVGGGSGDSAPRVLAVRPSVVDGLVRIPVGSGSVAGLLAGGAPASLVIVPDGEGELGAYSLIVDGSGTVDGESFTFAPSGAVWHRPAPRAAP